jgi:replicative DNA helicase
MTTSREVAEAAITQARERAASPAEVWGISWGIDGLDRVTHGILPGRMNVLVSRPNIGKSALAGGLLVTVGRQFLVDDSGKVVKLFTFEMSGLAVQHRLACQIADVSMHRIDTGFATPEQQAAYERAQLLLADLPIEYFDRSMNMTQIEREVRKEDTGFWVLDHLRKVKEVSGAANPYQTLNEVIARITTLTQQDGFTGLVITHQNRSKQNAVDKRADLESIAGSDQAGQDADLLLALYREDVGKYSSEAERDTPKPGELLVVKNRHGAANFGIEMLFLPKKAKWVEVAKQQPKHLTIVKGGMSQTDHPKTEAV